jgi:hypothetical protein
VNETFGEMLDTSPAQRRRYYEWLRTLTPQERALEVDRLSQSVLALACAGIRARDAGAGPREIARQLAERLYGRKITLRFFDAA